MIFHFKKSKKATIIGSIILTVIGYVILYLFFKDKEKLQIAYILVPVISVYISVYIGKVMAYKSYQEVLLLLYEKLDIAGFILEGEKLFQARISNKEKGLLALHLSNGYIAAGEFEKAKNILSQNKILAKQFSLEMEFSSNIIAAFIQNHEIKEAEDGILDLKKAVSGEKDKEKKIKIQKTLAYQQACLETVKGSNSYLNVLEKDYCSSKSVLHKISVSRYLLELYQRMENKEKRKQVMDYVLEHGNKHYLVKNIGV